MLFLANGEAEYFCKWGWTGKITSTPLICPSGKSRVLSDDLHATLQEFAGTKRGQARTPRVTGLLAGDAVGKPISD